MWNPLTILVTPLVFFSFIPLVGFAFLTTWIAFGILYLKALAVYLELGIVLFRNYLFAQVPQAHSLETPIESPSTPQRKRRKSRSSAHSSNSDLFLYGQGELPKTPFPHVSLGYQRDFESVGGYNFIDGPDDDEQWIAMNSSLELPAPGLERRRHVRSLTAQGLPMAQGKRSGTRSPRQTRLLRGNSAASLYTPANIAHFTNDSEYFPKMPDPRQSATAVSPSTTSSNSSRSHALQMKKLT